MFFVPQSTYSVSSPVIIILLRILTLLICAFLVAASFDKLPDKFASFVGQQTIPAKPKPSNDSTSNNQSNGGVHVLQGLLELLPHQFIETAEFVWQYGRDNQLAVVSVGLLTCITAIFLAGLMR